MGNCKDEMKSEIKNMKKNVKDVDLTKTKKGGLLGILPRKKKQEEIAIEAPRKFADVVKEADEKIVILIQQKELDLSREKGDEEYNQQALAILKTIQYHVDEIIEKMADYSELRSK